MCATIAFRSSTSVCALRGAERQQLLVRRAALNAARRISQRPGHRIGGRKTGNDPFGVPRDRGQQVVEIVAMPHARRPTASLCCAACSVRVHQAG